AAAVTWGATLALAAFALSRSGVPHHDSHHHDSHHHDPRHGHNGHRRPYRPQPGHQEMNMPLAAAAVLAGQLLLHLAYGDETFLYALNFLPLMVLLIALATRTRLRPILLTAILVLIPLLALHNMQTLRQAWRMMQHSPRPAMVR